VLCHAEPSFQLTDESRQFCTISARRATLHLGAPTASPGEPERLQKSGDLAREAVNCNAVLGGALGVYGIPIDKNDMLYGTIRRAGVVAQRGGPKQANR